MLKYLLNRNKINSKTKKVIFHLRNPQPNFKMKTKALSHLLVIFTLLLTSHSSFAQRNWLSGSASFAQLATDLNGIDQWRSDLKKSILNNVQELPSDIKQKLIENGEKYLHYDWPALPATQFLEFAENGNRSDYENSLGKRRAVLSALVIAELTENKGRFIPQIINGIWATCEESTWALPAHLSLQHHYTALPDPGENIVDLGDGMTTALISWTYFLLKDRLGNVTPVLPQRIRYELERRVISPYLQRDDFWWMGFHGQRVNNWNPWVNQNVLLTSLLTETDKDRIDSTVYRTMQSVDFFINQYPGDGGCDEGPAYWSHAGGELITYLELLRGSTNGKINITDRPLICNIGRYIYKMNIDKNSFVDFADAHPYLTPSISSIFKFGEACEDDTMKQFAAYFAQQEGNAANKFLRDKNNLPFFIDYLQIYPEIKNIRPNEPLMKLAWFPDLQVLTVRSKAGTAEGLFMAAKGGTNGESHNHNDVGNFIIYANGQPKIIDIGVGTYTRETFSKDRYKIFTMQSAWHNLPSINGTMQHEGLQYRAGDVHFSNQKNETELSMNIAGAYPKEAGVKSWIRFLDFRGNEVVLHEKYELEKYDTAFTLSLITPVQNIQVKGTHIILNDENGNGISIQFDPKHFNVKIENKALTDPALQHSWGKSLNRILLADKLHKLKGNYTLLFQEIK